MGQYYVCVSIDHNQYLKPSGGIKLMEHSYIGNDATDLAHYLLSPEGAWYQSRVVWAGDYMDEGLYLDQIKDLAHYLTLVEKEYEDYSTEYDENKVTLYQVADYFEEPTPPSDNVLTTIGTKYPYFLNHTKKEYFDLRKVRQQPNRFCIHPLPILTSSGNGRGGGDYWGLPQNKSLIGHWAGDVISAESEAPVSTEWTPLDPHFFELNDYPNLGESLTESRLNRIEFSDKDRYRQERFKSLLDLIEEFPQELKDVPLLKARLSKEDVLECIEKRTEQLKVLQSQLKDLHDQYSSLVNEDQLLKYDYNFKVQVEIRELPNPTSLELNEFYYTADDGAIRVLDYDIPMLKKLLEDVKEALQPVIEKERQVFAISTGELIDLEATDTYYICPCCGAADVLSGKDFNDDGIGMCSDCVIRPRTFTIFTPAGRRSKEVTVGPKGDFQSLTDLNQFLEKQNRFAQQTVDLPETGYRNKRLNFKEKLQWSGWDFSETGVIEKPLSRYQYVVYMK